MLIDMSKSNLFVKFLKNINKSINSLLEKNLNKLKLNNLINLSKNNKIILLFVALFILTSSYLVAPTFFKQAEINKTLKKELVDKYGLNFEFSNNIKYNFFPRPHFKINNSSISFDQNNVSKIEKIIIYISLENLFSLKKMKITDVILERGNFNLNKSNHNFFIDILNNDFSKSTLKIKNSNIFFRSEEQEVLLINRILKMKYLYDTNEFNNILYSENEIFNVPYSIQIQNNKDKKIFYTKLFINPLRLKIENEHNYNNRLKEGVSSVYFNNLKSTINYKKDKNFFEFYYLDKLENPNFIYEGKLNFKPFFSSLRGNTNKINFSYLIGPNALFAELLKTEILNNKNIEFNLKLNAKSIQNYQSFKNIIFKSNIEEGLVDFDNTKFEWIDNVEFELTDSLVFVKDGELTLDGKLIINIQDINEIYKFFVTPKNHRKILKKIDLNFSYNFDQNLLDLKDIKIDNKFNNNVNKILNNLILKTDNLQNKIYLKNLFNEAIKSYEG